MRGRQNRCKLDIYGRKHAHGAAPIVSRIYNVHVGGGGSDYVDPKINYERIRRQLNWIVKHQPKHFQTHVPGSRQFLSEWKKKGHEHVVLREIFESAIEFVGEECQIAMTEP